MTDALTLIVVGLNAIGNALGSVLLAPLALLPGWLSATLVAAGSGLLLLLAFKYTSNQRAIRAVPAWQRRTQGERPSTPLSSLPLVILERWRLGSS